MGKIIRSSNLMLRFYLSDGWEKSELDSVCQWGEVHVAHPLDVDPYYTLTKGSYFDCQKLLELASCVERRFDDHPEQTDLQFLESMNG